MLKTFSLTDIGKKRQQNQDYVYTSETPIGPLPNLFIAADGMGGHKAGDYASRCATEFMVEYISGCTEKNPAKVLGEAIEYANGRIRQLSKEHEDLAGMGTTVVAACVTDDELRVANVGDSRLYVIGEKITQITRDHSYVADIVRQGIIAPEDARNHPRKNEITRAVGAEDTIRVDFFTKKLVPGELVLLCSDGLTNMLEDEEIRMIALSKRDLVEAAEGLVAAANEKGGKDNIAVVLIEPF